MNHLLVDNQGKRRWFHITFDETVGAVIASAFVMGCVAIFGLALMPIGVLDSVTSNAGNYSYADWEDCPSEINEWIGEPTQCRSGVAYYYLFSYDIVQTRNIYEDGVIKHKGRLLASHVHWVPYVLCYLVLALFIASVYERRHRRKAREENIKK